MLNSRPRPIQERATCPSPGKHQDFLLLLASRIVSLAAGVGFVAVTARLFPVSGIAFLAWVVVLSNTAETLRGFGITNVLTRRLPQCDQDRAETRRWVSTHFLYASAPLLVLPIVMSPLVPVLWSIAAAGAALQLVANNHIYVFQAMGRFREVAVTSTLSTLLQRVAPLTAAWYWQLDLERFLLLQTLLSVPVFVALTLQLRGYLFSSITVPWREFWPQARAFYATGFVRYGATQADQLMVALLFPPKTLAPYFLARRLYSAVVVVLSAGVDVLIPQLGRLAHTGMEHVRIDQARILRKATAVCLLGGCLVAVNAGSLVPLVIGEAYAIPPFVVPSLMVAALGYGLFSFALAGEVVAGPPKETFRITLIAALVPLIVTPALVQLSGVAALPLALAGGYLVAAWQVFRRHEQLRLTAMPALLAITIVGVFCAAQERLPISAGAFLPPALILNIAALGTAALVTHRCGLLNSLGVASHE